MEAKELLFEIKRLSPQDKISLMEKTLESLREEVIPKSFDVDLLHAAKIMSGDYTNDTELTSFTMLDSENFYEAR